MATNRPMAEAPAPTAPQNVVTIDCGNFIVSKRLTSLYKSGPSKTWIKIKNPNSPAATRVLEGGFS